MEKGLKPSNEENSQLPTAKTAEVGVPAMAALNPMLPWLNMMPSMQIEYQQIEIRLQGEGAHISGRRASYKDGVINEERFNIQGPAQLYLSAAQQMQQQVQSMMNMLFFIGVSLSLCQELLCH